MQLLIEADRKRAVADLYSDNEVIIPELDNLGVLPLEIARVKRIAAPTGTRLFDPLDSTDWEFSAAIGSIGARAPVAGTFYFTFTGLFSATAGSFIIGRRYKILTYVSGDDFANVGASSNATGVTFTATGTTPTNWTNSSELQEVTGNISYDATAAQIATAINSTTHATAAGGVTVTAVANSSTKFIVLWNLVGSKAPLAVDSESEAPLVAGVVKTLVTGDPDAQQSQLVMLYQAAATSEELTDDLPVTGISVDVVATGGTGVNHKARVTITPLPYDGQLTITVGGDETAFIPFDAEAATVQAALEALASVGEDNVEVIKEATGQWLIQFIAAKAETDMGTIDADESALLELTGKSGELALDTAALDILLADSESVALNFSVRGRADSGDAWQVLFSQDVTIKGTVFA